MTSLSRRQWLILLGIAMAGFWIALALIERSLPPGTPGILQYEFVGSEGRAARFLAEWGGEGRSDVRLSLLVDFGFMVVYGSFFTLAGLATRDYARERGLRAMAQAGAVAPACAALAALFDAGENISLLLILGGHGGGVLPPLATFFASVKWVLVTLAIAYVLWGLVSRAWSAARAGR